MRSIKAIMEATERIAFMYRERQIDAWKANRMMRQLEKELDMHQTINDLCKTEFNIRFN